MDDLITAQEAAALLHLHVKRVQHLARTGELPAVRYGRKWLFRRDELVAGRELPVPAPTATRDRAARTTSDDIALEISARNRLRGRIVAIEADGVMAEVRLDIGGQRLVAVITRSSAERLRLAVGSEVLAVIKSTEVMIAREAGE